MIGGQFHPTPSLIIPVNYLLLVLGHRVLVLLSIKFLPVIQNTSRNINILYIYLEPPGTCLVCPTLVLSVNPMRPISEWSRKNICRIPCGMWKRRGVHFCPSEKFLEFLLKLSPRLSSNTKFPVIHWCPTISLGLPLYSSNTILKFFISYLMEYFHNVIPLLY